MLTTATRRLDAQFRLLRQHGMSVPDTVRHASSEVVFEEYPVLGFNYRMTDIQAAVGREQLSACPSWWRGAASWRRATPRRSAACPGSRLPRGARWARTNWQSYAVRLETGSTSGPSCSACSTTASPHGAA